MMRRIALGAAAVSLALGGVFAAATPASAKVIKPDATHVHCSPLTGNAQFNGPLTSTPQKKEVTTFAASGGGCVVTGPLGTAGTITKLTLSGSSITKNATLGGLLNPTPGAPPTVIKTTVNFLTAANGLVCSNKAKLGLGTPVLTPIGGGDSKIQFVVSSNTGGKGFGGKCFKGKPLTISATLDQTAVQILTTSSLAQLTFTGVHGPTVLDVG